MIMQIFKSQWRAISLKRMFQYYVYLEANQVIYG